MAGVEHLGEASGTDEAKCSKLRAVELHTAWRFCRARFVEGCVRCRWSYQREEANRRDEVLAEIDGVWEDEDCR